MIGKHVLVTTDHERRGVFAGVLVQRDGQVVVLKDAQMCIYWAKYTRGVLGLAAHGPKGASRIGPPVPRIELNGVTSITEMTKEAVAAWKAQPWST